MLIKEGIAKHLSVQPYECIEAEITENNTVLRFASVRVSEKVRCPYY